MAFYQHNGAVEWWKNVMDGTFVECKDEVSSARYSAVQLHSSTAHLSPTPASSFSSTLLRVCVSVSVSVRVVVGALA